ncbi:MAG: Tol-Pal system beta propeller repeat protein TolB [Candidatus Saccharicenans sp.]|jgi:TolB protein|nr:Tol-Pal system beta propeller repeat protein TolB [Candidatus Saccharicenans sp.]MDH7575396.1 Tol-Pal system beta propeller repeat protein TolB [Candidatus Saccharicenans sp.]
MKKSATWILCFIILTAGGLSLFSQQEIVLTIREGVPAISLALPPFVTDASSAEAREAAETIHRVLADDLNYSRVFSLVPREHLNYIRPLNPKEIFFKDWESIQARILVVGEVSQSQNRVIFEVKIYDVKSEKMILGKRYQADPGVFRLVAHRVADELMKLYGEKPYFTTKIVFVSNRDGNDELYMMDYDGANQTRLTFNKWRDYMPAWSPDQRAIVFTSYRAGNPDLYILYPYEGKLVPVSTKGTNFSGAFSPDGKKLAFCSTRDGNSEIYVAGADGSNARRITFNSAIDTAPSWSPTGREIAFTSDRTGTPQIYIMDAEGGNVRKVSFGGNYLDAPAWSPDGERIAFVSRVDNFFDIYILNLKTNKITKLTETRARNESPSWSPDGRHIIFSSNMSGSIQVYSVDYDASNLRCLTSQGENKLANWTN